MKRYHISDVYTLFAEGVELDSSILKTHVWYRYAVISQKMKNVVLSESGRGRGQE